MNVRLRCECWSVIACPYLLIVGLLCPALADATLPEFADVTREAGIDFIYVNGASGSKYMAEAVGSGAAFFDADGDGLLDLYVVNGAALPGYNGLTGPNRHYRNAGNGTFIDDTVRSQTGDEQFGMGAAVGDYDNDGDADLYLANYGPNVFYENDGAGIFTDITKKTGTDDKGWGTHPAFIDYDNDGDLDLYVANYMEFTPADNKQCLAGEVPIYCGPTTYPGQAGVLYRNEEDRLFTDVTRAAGLLNASGRQLAAVFGDYDNDGDADLFVANDKRPNFLFVNQGNGAFIEEGDLAGVAFNGEGVAESAMGADWGDYNNDGRLDIIVSTFQWETNTLYHNDGGGLFTDVTFAANLGIASVPFLGMTASFVDYDNDGFLDVFISNGHLDENVKDYDPATSYPQSNQLFRNGGEGRFIDVSTTSGPGLTIARVSHGAVMGDYDSDGDIDIFVSDSDGPSTLLRNDGGNSNNYLKVKTVGQVSNRDGIGARVRAVAGSLVQMREIRSSYGYMGSNEVQLTLGLGEHAVVDTLSVHWPSGIVQTLLAVDANQTLKISEARQ